MLLLQNFLSFSGVYRFIPFPSVHSHKMSCIALKKSSGRSMTRRTLLTDKPKWPDRSSHCQGPLYSSPSSRVRELRQIQMPPWMTPSFSLNIVSICSLHCFLCARLGFHLPPLWRPPFLMAYLIRAILKIREETALHMGSCFIHSLLGIKDVRPFSSRHWLSWAAGEMGR